MVYFNARRPTTMGALEELYSNPGMSPEQIDYSLTGQQRSYIHGQGEAMGIGDPSLFFDKRRREAALAATPSGGEIEALRQLGQLPGQQAEARRQSMWDAVAASKAQESAGLASLQHSRAMARFPIVPGQAPTLTPLERSEATRTGITAEEYARQQRLGGARTVQLGGADVPVSAKTGTNPSDLIRHPQFQAVYRSNPTKANQIFSAITGGDLETYVKGEQASEGSRMKEGVEFFRKGFQEGLFKRSPTGEMTMRTRVTDPATGRLVLGSDYGPLDEYSRGLWGEGHIQKAVLGDEQMRLSEYMAREKGAETAHAGKLASLQMGEAGGIPMVFQSKAFRRLMETQPERATAMLAKWKKENMSPAMGQAEYLTEPFRAPETAGFSWMQ